MHTIAFIHDLAIVMLTAGVVTVVFHLLRQPVVLGYIAAGVLIFATLTNVFVQNNINSSVQAVAKGVIIVVAVLLQQRFARRGTRG